MGKRMLIFDNDKYILNILKYILEAEGWEVFDSYNSNNVIEQVNYYKPSIIMMDNSIPDCGGVVATQSLKMDADLKYIPVIFLTANEDIEKLSQQAGADAYLAKPFDLVNLFNTIQHLSQIQEESILI